MGMLFLDLDGLLVAMETKQMCSIWNKPLLWKLVGERYLETTYLEYATSTELYPSLAIEDAWSADRKQRVSGIVMY